MKVQTYSRDVFVYLLCLLLLGGGNFPLFSGQIRYMDSEPHDFLAPSYAFSEMRMGPQIGQGGMGKTFVGTDIDGQTCIFKVNQVKFIDQLEGESEVLAFVTAQNIPHMVRFKKLTGAFRGYMQVLVMEKAPGENLDSGVEEALLRRLLPGKDTFFVGLLNLELKQFSDLEVFEARTKLVSDLSLKLSGAIGNAHAKGVVHRDIKPENIMYDYKTQTITLIDFGISMVYALEGVNSLDQNLGYNRDSPGTKFGSLGYFPMLEDIPSKRNRSEQDYNRVKWNYFKGTDRYALAVTYFEVLTGSHLINLADGDLKEKKIKVVLQQSQFSREFFLEKFMDIYQVKERNTPPDAIVKLAEFFEKSLTIIQSERFTSVQEQQAEFADTLKSLLTFLRQETGRPASSATTTLGNSKDQIDVLVSNQINKAAKEFKIEQAREREEGSFVYENTGTFDLAKLDQNVPEKVVDSNIHTFELSRERLDLSPDSLPDLAA